MCVLENFDDNNKTQGLLKQNDPTLIYKIKIMWKVNKAKNVIMI